MNPSQLGVNLPLATTVAYGGICSLHAQSRPERHRRKCLTPLIDDDCPLYSSIITGVLYFYTELIPYLVVSRLHGLVNRPVVAAAIMVMRTILTSDTRAL
jgi:hypothetical protein